MARSVQLLVFTLDDRLYALHLFQVDRVIRSVDATPLPQAPEIVLGFVDLAGMVLPLLNTRKRFGIVERDIGIDDQFIIARTSRRVVALAVDRVRDVIERPVDQIIAAERILRRVDRIEGVIQLEDGLTLIHDLERFLSLDEEDALTQALTMEQAHAGASV
jgi:purine-binding chemotaxis protein CheW